MDFYSSFSLEKVKVKLAQSCLTLCDPMDYTAHRILQARILEWVSRSLLQGIFPTQGSNPGVLHCRWILYQLSHQGSYQGAHPNLLFKDQLRSHTAFTFSVLLTTHLTIKCLLHCGHRGDSGAKP